MEENMQPFANSRTRSYKHQLQSLIGEFAAASYIQNASTSDNFPYHSCGGRGGRTSPPPPPPPPTAPLSAASARSSASLVLDAVTNKGRDEKKTTTYHADGQHIVENAVALAQYEVQEMRSLATPSTASTNPLDPGERHLTGRGHRIHEANMFDLKPSVPRNVEVGRTSLRRQPTTDTLTEVKRLQTEVAGMEVVVAAMKGYYERKTTSGKLLPSIPSQRTLMHRAKLLLKVRQEQFINKSKAAAIAAQDIKAQFKPDVAQFAQGFLMHAVPIRDTIEPMTRQDASLLGDALDEMLPIGAVTAKYRLRVKCAEQAKDLYFNMLRIKGDFELVDCTLRECARMVAAKCIQQAHTIEKVRERQVEVFNVMMYVAFMLQEAFLFMKGRHDKMQLKWNDVLQALKTAEATAAMEAKLRQQAKIHDTACLEEMEVLKEAQAVDLQKLHRRCQMLEAGVESERIDFQQKMMEKDLLLSTTIRELQDEVEGLKDDREDLMQRLRMSQRQLAYLKCLKDRNDATDERGTQTRHGYINSQCQDTLGSTCDLGKFSFCRGSLEAQDLEPVISGPAYAPISPPWTRSFGIQVALNVGASFPGSADCGSDNSKSTSQPNKARPHPALPYGMSSGELYASIQGQTRDIPDNPSDSGSPDAHSHSRSSSSSVSSTNFPLDARKQLRGAGTLKLARSNRGRANVAVPLLDNDGVWGTRHKRGGGRAEEGKRNCRNSLRSKSAPPKIRQSDKLDFDKYAKAVLSRKSGRRKRKTSQVDNPGGFQGLLKMRGKGNVKGTPWLMKTIVNIYADYLTQEKNVTRDGVIGQYANFNDFVYRWHSSKFGLQSIAEKNLLDLIATVRTRANSHKVSFFGFAIHVLPDSKSRGTLDHMDFYLACLRAFAGSKPVQTLFTVDDKVHFVDGINCIAQQIGDDSIKDIMMRALNLNDKTKESVQLSTVTPLLMDIFQEKWSIAQVHQFALLEAVDLDDDGWVDWNGFQSAAQLMMMQTKGSVVDQSTISKTFQSACQMSHHVGRCTLSDAQTKLRAAIERLWSLKPTLAPNATTVDEFGKPRLTAHYLSELRSDLSHMDQRIAHALQDKKSTHAIRAAELMQRVQTLLHHHSNRPMVIFMAVNVLSATLKFHGKAPQAALRRRGESKHGEDPHPMSADAQSTVENDMPYQQLLKAVMHKSKPS